MDRSSFYNDKRKERSINFLADYPVVRRYFCRKFDLTGQDFQFLCKLHSLGTFLRKDFENGEYMFSWDKDRWRRMLGVWIEVYRERQPSKGRKYKIYTISWKAKRMIEDCYRMLCGELEIPETPRYNPVMYMDNYQDKRHAAAIRAFNAARNNN